MKYFSLLAIALSGCVTTEDENGTRTTRWDAATTREVVDTGFGIYDRVRATQQPYPQTVIYP